MPNKWYKQYVLMINQLSIIWSSLCFPYLVKSSLLRISLNWDAHVMSSMTIWIPILLFFFWVDKQLSSKSGIFLSFLPRKRFFHKFLEFRMTFLVVTQFNLTSKASWDNGTWSSKPLVLITLWTEYILSVCLKASQYLLWNNLFAHVSPYPFL